MRISVLGGFVAAFVLASAVITAPAFATAFERTVDACVSKGGAIFVGGSCGTSLEEQRETRVVICSKDAGVLSLRADACRADEQEVEESELREAALCRQSGGVGMRSGCPKSKRVEPRDLLLCKKATGRLALGSGECRASEETFGAVVSGLSTAVWREFPPQAVVEHPGGQVNYAIVEPGPIAPGVVFVRPRSMIRLRVVTDDGLRELHWYRTHPKPLGFWRPDWLELPDPTGGVPPVAWKGPVPFATIEDPARPGEPEVVSAFGFRDLLDDANLAILQTRYSKESTGRSRVDYVTTTAPLTRFVPVGSRDRDFVPQAIVARSVDGARRVRVFGSGYSSRPTSADVRLAEYIPSAGQWHSVWPGYRPPFLPDGARIIDLQISPQGVLELGDDRTLVFARIRIHGGVHSSDATRDRIVVFDRKGGEATAKDLGAPPTRRGSICGGALASCASEPVWDNVIFGPPVPIVYTNPDTGEANVTLVISTQVERRIGESDYFSLDGARAWTLTLDENGWDPSGWQRLPRHPDLRPHDEFTLDSAQVSFLDGALRVDAFGGSDPSPSRDEDPFRLVHLHAHWDSRAGKLDWSWGSQPSPDGHRLRVGSTAVVDYTDHNYVAVFVRTGAGRVFEGSHVIREDGTRERAWQWTDLTPPAS